MTRRVSLVSLAIMLSISVSIASAGLELSFFLGIRDDSEQSDGVTVRFMVEDGDATEVFNEHWADLQWSDKFVVDLSPWGGKTVMLNLTTDPGPARNVGWDRILIGDAKITADGELIYDIGQAVIDGTQELSMLMDGDEEETPGLDFGALCTPNGGTVGGENKPKQFLQHPPWQTVGNAISRYEIALPAVDTAAVEASEKLASIWGRLKKY